MKFGIKFFICRQGKEGLLQPQEVYAELPQVSRETRPGKVSRDRIKLVLSAHVNFPFSLSQVGRGRVPVGRLAGVRRRPQGGALAPAHPGAGGALPRMRGGGRRRPRRRVRLLGQDIRGGGGGEAAPGGGILHLLLAGSCETGTC